MKDGNQTGFPQKTWGSPVFLPLLSELLFERSHDKIFLNPEEKPGKINFLGIFEKSYTAKNPQKPRYNAVLLSFYPKSNPLP
ncbi:hypothetical protein LK430_08705 [Acidaminococcus fermentans DSM 20731]|uniref:hypothetical protein n=1 Tax=Acidaminococcus fermentans TaxID=905 RepID=UPI0011D13F85|nr:hypothetical protein [Acidaminococcus fermentans]UEA71920.1 hypothetical protein LK430_08705 [Acidaminococcus fermentans DSM 20731]